MTHNFLKILALIVCIFQPINAGEKSRTELFQDIILTHPLPHLFRPGETYLLTGKIKALKKPSLLSCDLNFTDGNYHLMFQIEVQDDRFSFPLNLKYPGTYYLNLTLNYVNKGTEILKVLEPEAFQADTILPISHITFSSIDDTKSLMSWQTQNEIVQLQIIQDSVKIDYILTNTPQKFELEPDDFHLFKPGIAAFKIRAARSHTGSYYTKNSAWSEWFSTERLLTRKLPSFQKESVKFLTPFKNIGEINSLLWFNLNIKVAFQPRLFIKLPDGTVQENGLIKNNSLKKYTPGSTIQYLNQPGDYLFNYTPDIEGTYLFEIIDSYGSAILIVPHYCGNSLPLILSIEPDKSKEIFDLSSERIKMLLEINQIRHSLQLIPLILDSTLNKLGMYYVNRMATENFYGHVAPDKEDLLRRKKKFSILPTIRENIAIAPTIQIAQQNLINSPAHYAAMTDSTMRKAGFGLAKDKNGNFLLVQYFAGAPLIDFELEQVLVKIFQAMKIQRPVLTRIDEPDRLPFLKSFSINATDAEQLKLILLNGIAAESWLQPDVKKIYFESLTQRIEGLVLTIKLFP